MHWKAYQIIFPSSSHWPQTHSRWKSYPLPNEVISGCRRTKCSISMDLHFEMHLYLQLNNDMYLWNQVKYTRNYHAHVGMSSPYNQWSYPKVSCSHHPPLLKEKPSSAPIVLETDPVGSFIRIYMSFVNTILQKISTNKSQHRNRWRMNINSIGST